MLKTIRKHILSLTFSSLQISVFYILLSGATLLSYYILYGQYAGMDTSRYLRHSNNLELVRGHFYLTYFYLLFVKVHQSNGPIIFLTQCITHISAVLFLSIQLKKHVAPITSLLFLISSLLFYDQWKWAFAIMTESIFISLIHFYIAFLLILFLGKDKRAYYFLILITLIGLFTRANGIILLSSTTFLVINQTFSSWKKRILSYSLIVIGFFILFISLRLATSQYSVLGFIQLSQQAGKTIDPPIIWTWIPDNQWNNIQLLGHFFGLIMLRTGIFFTGVRPYFSILHNLTSLFFLLSIYSFILFKKHQSISKCLITLS